MTSDRGPARRRLLGRGGRWALTGTARRWGLALCGLLAIVIGGAPAWALPAQTWLLAIGNNLGDGDELGLRFAERDAQRFAEVLRQHGGIVSRRTTLLLGENAQTVRRALEDLNAEIRGQVSAGQPSALLVFYSGHADATSLHLRGTSLALDELKKLVQGSAATMRLLVVDACRSGTITRVKGMQPSESFDLQLLDGGGGSSPAEGLAILTSSSAGESSQESDRLRGSFFTHHLLNALRGAADRNGDGRITLSEAYSYTYDQTLRSSGRTLALQHPTYSFDLRGREDLVLSQTDGLLGQLSRLRLGGRALYLVSEERDGGPLLAELAPLTDRTTLVLPAGAYFVQQRLPAEYREYQVQLSPGSDTDLSTRGYRSVQYDRLVRYRGSQKLYAHNLGLFAGVHGPLLSGESIAPQLALGYGLDLPWLSLSARLHGGLAYGRSSDGLLENTHYELGLGLLLARYVDLGPVSFSFGLLLGGTYHHQNFIAPAGGRQAASRRALGLELGGLLALDLPLRHGLALRLELGPLSELLPQATTDLGAQTGQALVSPLTFFCNGGLLWRR
ncbi:MAG TPA: caspase family protein [Pseudomonadota bacterium]|nr:caspase family protein [Pseudomonadota bacterium]